VDIGAIFLNTPEPITIPATNKIAVGRPITRLRGILVLSTEVESILKNKRDHFF
jgi:hypothetical protein